MSNNKILLPWYTAQPPIALTGRWGGNLIKWADAGRTYAYVGKKSTIMPNGKPMPRHQKWELTLDGDTVNKYGDYKVKAFNGINPDAFKPKGVPDLLKLAKKAGIEGLDRYKVEDHGYMLDAIANSKLSFDEQAELRSLLKDAYELVRYSLRYVGDDSGDTFPYWLRIRANGTVMPVGEEAGGWQFAGPFINVTINGEAMELPLRSTVKVLYDSY